MINYFAHFLLVVLLFLVIAHTAQLIYNEYLKTKVLRNMDNTDAIVEKLNEKIKENSRKNSI